MKRLLAALLALALVFGGVRYLLSKRESGPPAGLIFCNGRLEGDVTQVSAKFAGRIHKLDFQEGDEIKTGQVLLEMDDVQAAARVRQARARVRQARAKVGEAASEGSRSQAMLAQAESAVAGARQGVRALESQLSAARTALQAQRQQVPLEIESARAGLQRAEARLALAQAAERQSARDAGRFAELARRGTVDVRRSEQATLAWTSSRSDLAEARAAVVVAEKQLGLSELGADRVRSQSAQVAALEAQVEQSHSSVGHAEGALREAVALGEQADSLHKASLAGDDEAIASLSEAASVVSDLRVRAPRGGTVTAKLVDLGEVVAAGTPLCQIVDLDQLYLKVFVPEDRIGSVHLGQEARIYIDSFPDQPIPARVRRIASDAEFTPKEVQTAEDRVKQVYAVKLYLEPSGAGNARANRLTPGLPADAAIRYQEGAPWARPRW